MELIEKRLMVSNNLCNHSHFLDFSQHPPLPPPKSQTLPIRIWWCKVLKCTYFELQYKNSVPRPPGVGVCLWTTPGAGSAYKGVLLVNTLFALSSLPLNWPGICKNCRPED